MRKIKMLTLGLVLAAIMGVNGFLAKTNSASASMELNIDNIERIAEGEPTINPVQVYRLVRKAGKLVWQLLTGAATVYSAWDIFSSDNESTFDGAINEEYLGGYEQLVRLDCLDPWKQDQVPNCNKSTFKSRTVPKSSIQ